MLVPVAQVQLDWLSAKEGGRKTPFTGSPYATNARFVGDSDTEIFSVVLRFENSTVANPSQGALTLLAPELLPRLRERLIPGARLEITEGPRTVARCQVVSVQNEQIEDMVAR
jgi:hypothetical protein